MTDSKMVQKPAKKPQAPKMKITNKSKGGNFLFNMVDPKSRRTTKVHTPGKLAKKADMAEKGEADSEDSDCEFFDNTFMDDDFYVRFPFFIVSISLCQIIIFGYYYYGIEKINDLTRYRESMTRSSLVYHPLKSKEVWRFLTYQFLHADIYHLLFNLIMRLLIGVPLEMVHNWWRVGLIYLVGVIMGALFSAVFNEQTMLMGASGGDFSMVFALLANFIMNADTMTNLNKIISILTVVMLATMEVCSTLFGHRVSVSWAAHLGGAIAGLIFGVCIVDNKEERPWEKHARTTAIVLFAIIITSLVWWIGFNGGDHWDTMMEKINNNTVSVAA